MPHVVGFTGDIGCGKTATATLLHEVAVVNSTHLEFSDLVIAMANRFLACLKDENEDAVSAGVMLETVLSECVDSTLVAGLAARLSLDGLREYLVVRRDISRADRCITVANKAVHRPVLQWLGHEMVVHVHNNFWAQDMERSIYEEKNRGRELITVGGVRYDNDAHTIHNADGVVAAVKRPGVQDAQRNHVSEQGIDRALVDVTIMNNHGLDELRTKVHRIWQDIQAGSLGEVY